MIEWLLLGLAVCIHELTHYIHFKIGGYNPKTRLSPIGLITESNNKENIAYRISNCLTAIGIGFIPLLFTNEMFLIYYLAMCVLDACWLFTVFDMLYTKKLTLKTKMENIKLFVDGKEIK